MADEPENLVLIYLRRLDEKVDGLRVDFVRLEHRIDRSDARLDRIERRLGLVDAEG